MYLLISSTIFSTFFFFVKQKTAYEMRISDWSSDVCSSDLVATAAPKGVKKGAEITEELLNEVERYEWWKFAVADDARQSGLEAVKAQYDEAVKLIVDKFEDRRDKLERGDEL